MSTLAEVLEYLELDGDDAQKVSAFIEKHGNRVYGINFHGSVMPYLVEKDTLEEIYDEDSDYYEEWTPEEDFARGFLVGEIDVYFEITDF